MQPFADLESQRPDVVTGRELDDVERAPGDHLRQVHDMYRAELDVVTALADAVRAGDADLADLRATVHGMALRANIEQFGALCARYCALVTNHHSLEDASIFPQVRAASSDYEELVDQLEHEHLQIHRQLRQLDDALVAFDSEPSTLPRVLEEVDVLARILRSHFAYEETQLAEPLALLQRG
jgi:hypothetical protein